MGRPIIKTYDFNLKQLFFYDLIYNLILLFANTKECQEYDLT